MKAKSTPKSQRKPTVKRRTPGQEIANEAVTAAAFAGLMYGFYVLLFHIL